MTVIVVWPDDCSARVSVELAAAMVARRPDLRVHTEWCDAYVMPPPRLVPKTVARRGPSQLTPEERRRVVADIKALGYVAASKRWGMSMSSVQRLMRQEGERVMEHGREAWWRSRYGLDAK